MSHPVVSFDIGCSDLGVSRAFYTGLFQWTEEPNGPLSVKLRTGSPQGISGATTALGHEPLQYLMIYVATDDIPATLARAVELGGQVVLAETPVPGQGSFAWIKDPAGNLLGLWKDAPGRSVLSS